MSQNIFLTILVVFFVSISSVDAKQESTLKDTAISWHKSGMPKALERAQKQNQPLFVYWGAVWCPPCNVIKSTLFKDPLFVQATHDYISVYLDGDTEEAQKWGEKLKVMGYPTLMILSPQGKEVLRLSPANSVDDLVSTMNYSRNVWNPIADILTQTLSSQQVDARKVKSLAMYSWSQDKEVSENAEDYSEKLFQLEDKLKNSNLKKERTLIFMTALGLKLESLEEKQELEQFQKKKYKIRIEEILNNPELLKANMSSLAYQAESLISHLTEDSKEGVSKERVSFIEIYLHKMQAFRNTKNISFVHYYSTFYPLIDFEESFEIKVEESDKKQLIAYTTKNLPKTKDPKAREVMINQTSYILFKFGMTKTAKQMLTTAMKTTLNPHYLMSTLGYFEKEEGNKVKALEWYEKAYQSAKGPATKLQWYGSFVRNLIELKPDDNASIKSHVNILLNDYTYMADSFWGRNYRVLVAVKKSINKWAEEKKEISWVKEMKLQGQKKCSLSKKEIYKSACDKFYQEFI